MANNTNDINKELRELELCDEGYGSLSPIKKKVNQGKEGKRGKLDSHGNPLEEIQKRDEKKKKEAKDQSEAVATMVAEAITRKPYYLLESNIFTKVDESALYVPAEISLVKFSIHEGIIAVYQAIPEAGIVPLGYRRQCLETSSRGHKIPLGNDKKEEENVRVKSDYLILEDIQALLAGTNTVFCMPERLDQCKGVMKTISERSYLENPVKNFMELPELFYQLVNSSQHGMEVPSRGLIEEELNRER